MGSPCPNQDPEKVAWTWPRGHRGHSAASAGGAPRGWRRGGKAGPGARVPSHRSLQAQSTVGSLFHSRVPVVSEVEGRCTSRRGRGLPLARGRSLVQIVPPSWPTLEQSGPPPADPAPASPPGGAVPPPGDAAEVKLADADDPTSAEVPRARSSRAGLIARHFRRGGGAPQRRTRRYDMAAERLDPPRPGRAADGFRGPGNKNFGEP